MLLMSAQKGLSAPHGGRPNKFECDFIIRVGTYDRQSIVIAVRDDDDNPSWLIHPTHDRLPIDIVAIPLGTGKLGGKIELLPINKMAPGKLWISIGMEVFILGYPFGGAPPAFPIWKRGSIASEPDLVRLNKPYYLVDTASRPGMSGSPTILRSWSNHILESNLWVASTDKPIDRVIGVYSGRLDDDQVGAQIGMVWHVDYIDEIIDCQRADRG